MEANISYVFTNMSAEMFDYTVQLRAKLTQRSEVVDKI